MTTATNVSNPNHITFETWGQAENDWKAREGRFTDRALKLKAELLASTDQYEMVILDHQAYELYMIFVC